MDAALLNKNCSNNCSDDERKSFFMKIASITVFNNFFILHFNSIYRFNVNAMKEETFDEHYMNCNVIFHGHIIDHNVCINVHLIYEFFLLFDWKIDEWMNEFLVPGIN